MSQPSTPGGEPPAGPPPTQRLPDSLFIFVMCCCAIAIAAVVFVFVYYCYLNGRLCFPERRRFRLGGSAAATAPADGDDDDDTHGGDAVVMMEARLLPGAEEEDHRPAQPPSSMQQHQHHQQHADVARKQQAADGHAGGAGGGYVPVMDAAALSRAKFTTENVRIRDLDAGDDHTVSGFNAPPPRFPNRPAGGHDDGDRAPAAAYYDGNERLEFLVLPEKAASVVATNASNGGSDGNNNGGADGGDAAATADEAASTASGASTAQRRWLGEWLTGVVKALRASRESGVPLEDPCPPLSPTASSPYSSDHATDSDPQHQPLVPTAKRLQMLHRLSRASDSSMSTQPSTTIVAAGGCGADRSPTLSAGPRSPQVALPRAAGPVPSLPMANAVSLPRPPRRGTTSTQPARAQSSSQPQGLGSPTGPQVVTLAQLMEDPFGRNFPRGAPVILTPDARREQLVLGSPPDAGAAHASLPQPMQPTAHAAGAPSSRRQQPHQPQQPQQPPAAAAAHGTSGTVTPRRILSDTTSSSSASD